MKLVADYLDRAAQFERMAAETDDPELKGQLRKQAEDYWKLATKRATQLGVPPPVRSGTKQPE
jgi:hypothetical protein